MRHNRGFAVYLKRSQLLFKCPIGEGHALVLSQVLGPVLRDERLDMPRWIGRIREMLPEEGSVPF
jgi:hypothetical protein